MPAEPSRALARAINAAASWSARWVPSSFAIACLLTLVTFVLVVTVAGKNPIAAEGYWTKGFWELLELTMQLALIVLTGYIVAVSPAMSRLLEFVATASTERARVALMGLVSMTASASLGPRSHRRADLPAVPGRRHRGSTTVSPSPPVISVLGTWHAGLSGPRPS
jgi:short-chain fatty acids transporter